MKNIYYTYIYMASLSAQKCPFFLKALFQRAQILPTSVIVLPADFPCTLKWKIFNLLPHTIAALFGNHPQKKWVAVHDPLNPMMAYFILVPLKLNSFSIPEKKKHAATN